MRRYKHLPNVLKGVPKWVVYGKSGKGIPLKKPYNPNTGEPARVDDPKTWATFEECEKQVEKGRYCGVGYVFTGDYVVIDLDSVIDAKGRILPIAEEFIKTLDSYTEYSISKRGVHIVVARSNLKINKTRASLPVNPAHLDRYTREELDRITGEIKQKTPEIEIYTTGRYIAMTGDVMKGRTIIKQNAQALQWIYNNYIEPKATPKQYNHTTTTGRTPEPLDDREEAVLQLAFRGKNGKKIKALWEGSITGYESQSEADLALCNYLAFYTNKDPEAINRLFVKSGLYRDKWEEDRGGQTYGEKTIRTAIENFKGRTIGTYKHKRA